MVLQVSAPKDMLTLIKSEVFFQHHSTRKILHANMRILNSKSKKWMTQRFS